MLALAIAASTGYDNGSPHSRLPPLGWSSWVALGPGAEHPIFDFCDEASVMKSIEAFHNIGLYSVGYRHFHLDDCWAGGRNSTGFLYPEPDRFPNGLKKVIDYAHNKNLTFGVYTCAGTKTCVGGRPGSKGYWTQDANVFAEWGVDWVKMDCTVTRIERPSSHRPFALINPYLIMLPPGCNTEGMHPKEAYAKMSAAMNATGRHMHLNMCEWGKENPWEWGDHIAQSWRMSGDHTGVWSSTKQQIRESAAIPANYTGRPFGWNDMDMLETGNYKQAAHANHRESNMTSIEYHTEFSMWAISASPLVVTTPIMNCTAAQSKADGGAPVTCRGWISELQRSILLNSEVLAINQDVTPQGRPVKEQDLRVWARHLSDGSVAVALYNEQDVAQRITVAFTDLGWDASTRASIRDLWAKADEGTFVGKYPIDGGASVAPHATRLLRLTRSTLA